MTQSLAKNKKRKLLYTTSRHRKYRKRAQERSRLALPLLKGAKFYERGVEGSRRGKDNLACHACSDHCQHEADEEPEVKRKGESGRGILAVLDAHSKTHGYLMLPKDGKDSCMEYVCHEAEEYQGLDDLETDRKVLMLDLPKHSIWPYAQFSQATSARGWSDFPHVSEKPLFYRTLEKEGQNIEREYQNCGTCMQTLVTADIQRRKYVFCQDCEKVYHTQCLRTEKGNVVLPLKITGTSLYDRNNCAVICPNPTGQAHEEEPGYITLSSDVRSTDTTPQCSPHVCVDIGSTMPRASVKWVLPSSSESDFQEVRGKLPLSAVWVSENGHVRTSPYHTYQSEDTFIAPIKRVVFEPEAFEHLGRNFTKKAIFQLFSHIMREYFISKNPVIERNIDWVKEPGKGRVLDLYIHTALPSGLSSKQLKPVLAALKEVGECFLQREELKLDLSQFRVHPTVLPESEMGLLGSQRDLPDESLKEIGTDFVAVCDAGATSFDLTLHDLRKDLMFGQHMCYLADNALYGATIDALKLNERMNFNFTDWHELVDRVIQSRTNGPIEWHSPKEQRALETAFRDVTSRNDFKFDQRLSAWCERIKVLLSDRGDLHLSFVLCGGGMLNHQAYQKYKQIIETKLPHASIINDRSSSPSTSTVLTGLQVFADNCEKSRYATAPITILQQTDTPSDDSSAHVVLMNKGDGLGPGTLLPSGQPRPGELLTIILQWTDDGLAKIPIYAQHDSLDIDTLVIQNDLLTTPGDCANGPLYLIGQVEIERQKLPDGIDCSRAYLASWPNPYGRTIRTVLYMLLEKDKDTDVADPRLHEIAKFKLDEIHGLDTFSVQYRKDRKEGYSITTHSCI